MKFGFWKHPDIFNINGKNHLFHFSDPEYMDVLNPSLVGRNKSCVAAAMWHGVHYAWITVLCHHKFDMRLVCQKTKKMAVEKWVPHCFGQTTVLMRRCIVHTDANYIISHDTCKPFTMDFSGNKHSFLETYLDTQSYAIFQTIR